MKLTKTLHVETLPKKKNCRFSGFGFFLLNLGLGLLDLHFRLLLFFILLGLLPFETASSGFWKLGLLVGFFFWIPCSIDCSPSVALVFYEFLFQSVHQVTAS